MLASLCGPFVPRDVGEKVEWDKDAGEPGRRSPRLVLDARRNPRPRMLGELGVFDKPLDAQRLR